MTGGVVPFRPWWEAPGGLPPGYRPSPAMAYALRYLQEGFPKAVGAAPADNDDAPPGTTTGAR